MTDALKVEPVEFQNYRVNQLFVLKDELDARGLEGATVYVKKDDGTTRVHETHRDGIKVGDEVDIKPSEEVVSYANALIGA